MALKIAPCQTAEAPFDRLSYDFLLEWADLVSRTIRNKDVSLAFRALYLGFVDAYPEVLQGGKFPIQVWKVREAAGWLHKNSARDFFKAMQEIDALTYDPGKYNAKEEDRIAIVEINPDVFPYPELFNTRETEGRRKAREAEEKRRKLFKDPRQMLQCPECGSNHILWDATPHCENCHTVYPTVKDIPASEITIEGEVHEIADDFSDWLDAPTEQRPAVSVPKTPRVEITQATLASLAPASAPVESILLRPLPPFPDQPCAKCGRPQRVCFAMSPDGQWDFTCTRDMWIA